jgi:hypothetical protein
MGQEDGRAQQRELSIEKLQYLKEMEDIAVIGAQVANVFWDWLDVEMPEELAKSLTEIFFYNYLAVSDE